MSEIPAEAFLLTSLGTFFIALAFVLIAIFIGIAIQKTRSRKYRETLVDMYVVGMIKKFAVEDKIDLIKELREFARIEKKAKIYEKGLDKVIEQELKEKIAKVSEEKVETK